MATDIFEFWQHIKPDARIHPADEKIFSRVKKHHFDLSLLPGHFMGPLRTAQVVLLYLSPGRSEEDKPTKRLIDWHKRRRSGDEPLPNAEIHQSAFRWWTSRTKCFGVMPEKLSTKIAVLNIGAYHSDTLDDTAFLMALPSSRVSLDWAQEVLFPEAEAGKRVVVCLRAAERWGLERGRTYGRSLFAPDVNRSGHMLNNALRSRVLAAVRDAIKDE